MGKSAINPAVVGKHSTDIAALKNDLGIVEDGDTATHTIAQGQYVIWQGALYTADAAIASGTTLAASGGNKNLTAVGGGGLNAVKASVDSLNSDLKNRNQTTFSTLAALYNAGTALREQGAKFVVVTNNVTNALTNNVVSGASRGFVSLADTNTIDLLMYSISSSKVYVCRMTNASTVTGIYVI